jgi:DNA-binding NarL/FixJ family response regulator
MRLFLAARVRLYREELAHLIGAVPGISVVGVAATAEACTAGCLRVRPDVVLLDAELPAAAEIIAGMRKRLVPPPAVIALGVAEVEGDVIALAEAGAANFITIEDSFEDLIRAVEALNGDALPCSSWVAGALLRRVQSGGSVRGPVDTLTRREREVAGLLQAGLSNKQIGRELCIELPTVKNHVHNVLDKLQVTRRAEVRVVEARSET